MISSLNKIVQPVEKKVFNQLSMISNLKTKVQLVEEIVFNRLGMISRLKFHVQPVEHRLRIKSSTGTTEKN